MIRGVLAGLTASCLVAGAAGASTSSSSASAPAPEVALRSLFKSSNEARLELNPLEALYRGDLRYADRFGDYVTDAYYAALREQAVADIAALEHIDRRALGPADRISYDVFKFSRSDDLKSLEPRLLESWIYRPIDQMNGFQTQMPELSSGDSLAPFNTVLDYENNLKRLGGYVLYLDRAIGRMQQGMAAGVVNPRLVMRLAAAQFDALIAEGVEGSTFYRPVKKFPNGVPKADRKRLTAAYATFIREQLIPAHTKIRDFIKNDYLPKARDSVGLSDMPGGAEYYRYLVASATTTTMTPEAIHALGLSEVARILSAMDKVKETVGFKGTLAEFANLMRTDPRFAPSSPEAMRDAFLAIDKKVLKAVPRDFDLIPKSTLEVRPVPSFKEKTEPGGSYQGGTPDGARPGVFYYNAYDLPMRFTWGFETLFLHEGIPGHHFQVSLAQEDTSLPPFQRFEGNTAYVEGWALYSESLGAELGMFTDPYQLYGHLNDEMLRAMRLVVDTGIHTQHWSRDQSISYMLDNSAMSRTDATAEVDRYIAMPGQALAYTVGELTIRRLRTAAEQALGPRFDVRAFHAQVLASGALPMAVLESKINDWIAAELGSVAPREQAPP